jgi:hypothetical protein
MAPRIRRLGGIASSIVAVLLVVGGQTRSQSLQEGWGKLNDEYSKEKRRANDFSKGLTRVNPEDPNDLRAIDVLAKYHTYGVYLQNLETKDSRHGIDNAYKSFEKDMENILNAKDRQTMQPFSDVFRDKIRIHALEVLEFEQAKPIHKVYNARVLAKIAELGQRELADTLVKVLKNPKQNDGVRYYILRGMGTLLAQVQPSDNKPMLTDEQAKCATALVEFLEERKGPDKNAAPEEIDGFRLLRREAVRALAQVHFPSVNDKVRPALVLAKFAGNDESIQPPPRIDERVEAALGLTRMQSMQDPRYQPDYAAGQIAKCLGAFATMSAKDIANVDKSKEKQIRPWRVDAALLKGAMETLKTNNPKNAFVGQVADRGASLLDKIIRGTKIDDDQMAWWSSPQSAPPSKELFQGKADTVVKPAGNAEPEK